VRIGVGDEGEREREKRVVKPMGSKRMISARASSVSYEVWSEEYKSSKHVLAIIGATQRWK